MAPYVIIVPIGASWRKLAPPTLAEGLDLIRGKLGRQEEIGQSMIEVDRDYSPDSTQGESPGHDKAKKLKRDWKSMFSPSCVAGNFGNRSIS